jgi:lipopolysaccharide transport system ATP-binding protein
MTAAADRILELEGVEFSYKQRHALFRYSSFKAIRGATFSVRRGETVGIIGRNGCGKSTLLRVIAGIFRPDAGTLNLNCGGVSLLSLSLGFDPELSGRENAVIAGMLQGAGRRQVESELDRILEFSELGAFIDEPLRTYSTGMRARLGFSVAISLRTDLLLVDEILSVGDAQFRKKAEKAMVGRISSNQTVLMVSHSLPQIRRLCDRVVWLERGQAKLVGEPGEVISAYEEAMGVAD